MCVYNLQMLISTRKYLQKLHNPGFSGDETVSGGTDLIITIPCYNEPDIQETIQSLFACDQPACDVEVLVLVNAYEHTPNHILSVNESSYAGLKDFAKKYNTHHFKIIPLYTDCLSGKQTGAGIPRKILMDEALRRLVSIDNESGIIVSLDADCTVDSNYLTEIYKAFHDNDKLCAATIAFHHPVTHLSENDPLRIAAESYEMYLHYYRLALEYCGYPYPYYTIGSAMAFRASVYTRAGGMGKQSAGEDFYFLQKVFPLGEIKHIDTTKVYPAARFSDRVPFGTGPALQKMVSENQLFKKTYSLESFLALKLFFSRMLDTYESDISEIADILTSLPVYLQEFLKEDHFLEHLGEIRSNVSSFSFFKKRFFHYFNAFKIVKYLNFVHPEKISLREVRGEAEKLAECITSQQI